MCVNLPTPHNSRPQSSDLRHLGPLQPKSHKKIHQSIAYVHLKSTVYQLSVLHVIMQRFIIDEHRNIRSYVEMVDGVPESVVKRSGQ